MCVCVCVCVCGFLRTNVLVSISKIVGQDTYKIISARKDSKIDIEDYVRIYIRRNQSLPVESNKFKLIFTYYSH